LRFLFNAMASKDANAPTLQGIPEALYLDNGPIAKSTVFKMVMERLGVRRHERFQAEQRFENYAEFLAKVTPQGPVAIERAQRFAVKTNIVIPMSYDLNLL